MRNSTKEKVNNIVEHLATAPYLIPVKLNLFKNKFNIIKTDNVKPLPVLLNTVFTIPEILIANMYYFISSCFNCLREICKIIIDDRHRCLQHNQAVDELPPHKNLALSLLRLVISPLVIVTSAVALIIDVAASVLFSLLNLCNTTKKSDKSYPLY